MLRELNLIEMEHVSGGTCPDHLTDEECEAVKELIRNEGTGGIPNPTPSQPVPTGGGGSPPNPVFCTATRIGDRYERCPYSRGRSVDPEQ